VSAKWRFHREADRYGVPSRKMRGTAVEMMAHAYAEVAAAAASSEVIA